MNAVDSSVAVPALLPIHADHDAMQTVGGAGRVLPGHAALETYSVLTRIRPGRLSSAIASAALAGGFAAVIPFPEARQSSLVATLAAAGIAGGAVYDALVGLTALEHGARLFTRDRRAAATYAALGVEIEWCG